MASTPIPPSIEHLAGHAFAFFPAILNEAHNEWLFRKATWSEILVANSLTGAEIWIPRRYVGEVSRTDDPILIVGLNRELEMKGGMVMPYQRRVIGMPVAVGGTPATSTTAPGHSEPAPLSGFRLDASDRGAFKLILCAVAGAIVLYLLAVNMTRVGELRQRVTFTGNDQSFANLGSHDDYAGISEKLGTPVTDREQEIGTILYRALGYPARKYTVILMGRDKGSMAYIGTMDQNWHPIHAVNARTQSLLRGLKQF